MFLPGEELWDPNFQRLTMTFDPGRIKRGLTSNETIGPPIAEGKRYTLVIDRDWQDARGVPMVEGFRKSVSRRPSGAESARSEELAGDRARSRARSDALVVDFPKPMNYALLQRMLQVSSTQGSVGGTVSVASSRNRWRFTPQQPWKTGDYQLIVDTGDRRPRGQSHRPALRY